MKKFSTEIETAKLITQHVDDDETLYNLAIAETKKTV